MLCRQCSSEISGDYKFCPICGTPFPERPERKRSGSADTGARRSYAGASFGIAASQEPDRKEKPADDEPQETPPPVEPAKLSRREKLLAFRTSVRSIMVEGVIGYDERQNLYKEARDFGLAVAQVDGLIRAMEGVTEIRRFDGHDGGVTSAVFLPDGRRVMSAGFDTSIRLWDVTTGYPIRGVEIQGQSSVTVALAISPDGRRVLSAEGDTVRMSEITSGRELRRFQVDGGGTMSVAFSPDAWEVCCASSRGIYLWETESGREVRRVDYYEEGEVGGAPRSVAFSPGGRIVACGSASGDVRFIDILNGWHIRTFEEVVAGPVYCLGISSDDRLGISGDNDGRAVLWNMENGKEIRRIPAHIGSVQATAFSPDGKFVLSGGEDGTLRLWELPPEA